MNGWMDGQIGRGMDRWVGMDGRVEVVGCKDGWMDE